MRVIGLDVSRAIVEIAYLEDGLLREVGRVLLQRNCLLCFAQELRARPTRSCSRPTSNTAAIVTALKPYAARVVIANSLKVRTITEALVNS